MSTRGASPLMILGTGTAVALAAVVFVAACDMAATSTTDPGQADVVPAEPTFIPYTTAPTLLNREEVVQAMRAAYPPLLREAGIGGTVRVYFYIGADGRVLATRIHESPGLEPLDQAALAAASVFRFSPAMNHDEVVAVWVSLPITFRPAQGQPAQASKP
jgi:protein TonB